MLKAGGKMDSIVKPFLIACFGCVLFLISSNIFAHLVDEPVDNSSERSDQYSQVIHYNFASIELLIEQEVGRIVLEKVYKNIGLNIHISPLPGNRAQYVATQVLKTVKSCVFGLTVTKTSIPSECLRLIITWKQCHLF